ncbi:MAG TPA: hypothetical protein VF174_13135 [Micromonosporaceae bacterium]
MSQIPPVPDPLLRKTAERAAAAHTAVSRELEDFLRRVSAAPTPAEIAEYAHLISREQAVRIDRDAALNALGLEAPSIEPE